jgi:predicted acyl esterase
VSAPADGAPTRPEPVGAISRSEVRDGMRIDFDVPITMDDGLVLRGDVFRPLADGKYPVLLTYGPYAKGLAFQDGYPSAWNRMAEPPSRRDQRLDQRLPELGGRRS